MYLLWIMTNECYELKYESFNMTMTNECYELKYESIHMTF